MPQLDLSSFKKQTFTCLMLVSSFATTWLALSEMLPNQSLKFACICKQDKVNGCNLWQICLHLHPQPSALKLIQLRAEFKCTWLARLLACQSMTTLVECQCQDFVTFTSLLILGQFLVCLTTLTQASHSNTSIRDQFRGTLAPSASRWRQLVLRGRQICFVFAQTNAQNFFE